MPISLKTLKFSSFYISHTGWAIVIFVWSRRSHAFPDCSIIFNLGLFGGLIGTMILCKYFSFFSMREPSTWAHILAYFTTNQVNCSPNVVNTNLIILMFSLRPQRWLGFEAELIIIILRPYFSFKINYKMLS